MKPNVWGHKTKPSRARPNPSLKAMVNVMRLEPKAWFEGQSGLSTLTSHDLEIAAVNNWNTRKPTFIKTRTMHHLVKKYYQYINYIIHPMTLTANIVLILISGLTNNCWTSTSSVHIMLSEFKQIRSLFQHFPGPYLIISGTPKDHNDVPGVIIRVKLQYRRGNPGRDC